MPTSSTPRSSAQAKKTRNTSLPLEKINSEIAPVSPSDLARALVAAQDVLDGKGPRREVSPKYADLDPFIITTVQVLTDRLPGADIRALAIRLFFLCTIRQQPGMKVWDMATLVAAVARVAMTTTRKPSVAALMHMMHKIEQSGWCA